MGICRSHGMMQEESAMRHLRRTLSWLLAAALAGMLCPLGSQAKGYSSGGHSYSSSSRSSGSSGSHSFSSGGSHSFGGGSSHSSNSKSFQSGSGKSYSSGSTWKEDNRHGYSAGKSYSSDVGHLFSSGSKSDRDERPGRPAVAARRTEPGPSHFSFDTAAARAQQEQTSRRQYQQFKEARSATRPSVDTPGAPSYQGKPPPIIARNDNSYRPPAYIPDTQVIVSRPARTRLIFEPYYSRPMVVYHDPYSSLFWWWLMDRSLEDRAWWAYHHRYDMDSARYQALLASDQQLEARVGQLETQQVARDPNYVPTGLDRDLMYSDRYVAHSYSNRPTLLGVWAFRLLGIPTALALCAFFIWLIWFKRWQTAT
jgi:hypothetical protein